MTVKVTFDSSELRASLGETGDEFQRVAEERIAPAAKVVEDAFADASRAIERELIRAARTGEISMKRLGRSIVSYLSVGLADNLVRRPIENLLTSAFTGGRAEGGLVAPGQRYLVGERGPEIFSPSVAGRIGDASPPHVHVSISLPSVTDAASFRESESQIAAGLARALGRGGRNQ
ncbi:MAG: hypothetical protein AAFX08_08895 [Pseudomonadota bacterium]